MGWKLIICINTTAAKSERSEAEMSVEDTENKKNKILGRSSDQCKQKGNGE